MKPINIIRCQNLLDSISPRAMKAWKELWEKPTKDLLNLRLAAELMSGEELDMHFDKWYEVMMEDIEDRKLREKNKNHVMRSTKEEVRNHVLELYVIVREVLSRYYAGRLHVGAGLLARSGGPSGVKRSVGHQSTDS